MIYLLIIFMDSISSSIYVIFLSYSSTFIDYKDFALSYSFSSSFWHISKIVVLFEISLSFSSIIENDEFFTFFWDTSTGLSMYFPKIW